MSQWTEWEPCPKSCGGGKSTRSRTSEEKPRREGQICKDETEEKDCNQTPCPSAGGTFIEHHSFMPTQVFAQPAKKIYSMSQRRTTPS